MNWRKQKFYLEDYFSSLVVAGGDLDYDNDSKLDRFKISFEDKILNIQ